MKIKIWNPKKHRTDEYIDPNEKQMKKIISHAKK